MRPMVSGGVGGATTTPQIGAPQVRLKCFARVRPTWPGELLRPGVYQSIEIEDNRTIRSSRLILILYSSRLHRPPSSRWQRIQAFKKAWERCGSIILGNFLS